MKINWLTFIIAIIAGILGVIEKSLTNGTVQTPTADAYVLGLLLAGMVAATKHVADVAGTSATTDALKQSLLDDLKLFVLNELKAIAAQSTPAAALPAPVMDTAPTAAPLPTTQ